MTEETTAAQTRQQALNAASGAASKRLKEAHLQEWNTYMAEEAARRNQRWTPKPSAEEKARQELQRLLAEHPGLALEIEKQRLTEEMASE